MLHIHIAYWLASIFINRYLVVNFFHERLISCYFSNLFFCTLFTSNFWITVYTRVLFATSKDLDNPWRCHLYCFEKAKQKIKMVLEKLNISSLRSVFYTRTHVRRCVLLEDLKGLSRILSLSLSLEHQEGRSSPGKAIKYAARGCEGTLINLPRRPLFRVCLL